MTLKKNSLHTIIAAFTLLNFLSAQPLNSCIEEIKQIEAEVFQKGDSLPEGKCLYVKYTVKATDWDNETTVSNVKFFRKNDNLNFFSEQATIFQDNKDVIIVLPTQKTIIINNSPKAAGIGGLNKEIMELRNEFMDSCIVVKCSGPDPVTKNKTLVLKTKSKEYDELTHIKKISYTYNYEEKKIVNIKTEYYETYKLKEVTTYYASIKTIDNYNITPNNRAIADKRGRILPKYQGFEIMDSRDPVYEKKR